MLHRLRRRAENDDGFTMIELLVVILIIGVLAAIAIPSFLNQKSKGNDASAKELARTAQTASETVGADTSGDYSSVSLGTLQSIEATISTSSSSGGAYLSAASGTTNTYTVTATSPATNNTYTIVRNSDGSTTRSCSTAGSGGCLTGTW